jgi:hypothetical protein
MSMDVKVMKHGKDEASTQGDGCRLARPRHAYFAFLDGMATLGDVLPEPRSRTIRAFKHHVPAVGLGRKRAYS